MYGCRNLAPRPWVWVSFFAFLSLSIRIGASAGVWGHVTAAYATPQQTTADNRKSSPLAFLADVEAEVRGSADLGLRAYGLARLAGLFWRYNREHARQLWQEAFALSLEMKSESVGVIAEGDSATWRASLYRRATEASPGRVQALIFRELADRKEFEIADELLFRLPRREVAETRRQGQNFPFVISTEQDLAQALLKVPLSREQESPQHAHRDFTWIVARFENFPYGAAAPYLKSLADKPERRRLAVEVLAMHFKARKLSKDDLGVTLTALRGFSDLLDSMEPFDARRNAKLLQEKINELKQDSAQWTRLSASIELKLCTFLESPVRGCQEKPALGPPDTNNALPTDAARITETQRAKGEAVQAWRKGDTAKAEALIEGLDDPLSRAEVWIQLAAISAKDNSREQSLKRAIAELRKGKKAPKSRRLYVITLGARTALQIDRALFEEIVSIGLDYMGDEPFESKEDAEQAAYVDLGVRLVALWSVVEPERAVERIRAVADPAIRVRAFIEIAAADQIQAAWRP
ncbi:MAG: hypothetical protein L0Z53_04760 [Acidobacteriales bacterium]|nr:hypothetical protein [Terriglobales bacterium]